MTRTKSPQVHQAVEPLAGADGLPQLAYQIIVLSESVFVWVGTAPESSSSSVPTGRLDQLAVGMPSRLDTTVGAISTTLIRPSLESQSEGISRRLAARLKRQAFVAIGLDASFSEYLPRIERRLAELSEMAIASSVNNSESATISTKDAQSSEQAHPTTSCVAGSTALDR